MREVPEMNTMFFDSISDLGSYAKANNLAFHSDRTSSSWFNETSIEKSLEMAITGDESCVGEAEKLMGKFTNTIETLKAKTISDVVGGFASVPAYLSGNPQSMRRRSKVKVDVAPLNILVDVSCSAEISAEKMKNRGIAILSLVMLLASSRPVSLHVSSVDAAQVKGENQIDGDCFSMVIAHIETAPLDLGTAAYALTNVAFSRRILLGIAMIKYLSQSRWPTFVGCKNGVATTPAYRAKVLHYAGMSDDTLYIPAASVSDPDSNMLMNEPIKWVSKMVTELSTSEEI